MNGDKIMNRIKMAKQLREILKQKSNETFIIKQINQGYYGYIYMIINADNGKKFIAKIYKNDGYAKREQAQLEMLRKYALVHVPEIISISLKTQNNFFDVIFMEFINGVDGSKIKLNSENEKIKLSNEIIDNLLAIHEISNETGFGDFVLGEYFNTWEEYYKKQIDQIYCGVQKRHIRVSRSVMKTVDTLYQSYDCIFNDKVKTNSLIHGDYNLWNLIIDLNTNKLIGMIDPMGSSFADRELELFQLENANGKEYHLLENYRSQIQLSDNFELKNFYYRFWDDLRHFVNAGYYDNKLLKHYGESAIELLQ